MDFIVLGLATRKIVRILSVVDAYTRECLAPEVDICLGSGRVTRVLERLPAQPSKSPLPALGFQTRVQFSAFGSGWRGLKKLHIRIVESLC